MCQVGNRGYGSIVVITPRYITIGYIVAKLDDNLNGLIVINVSK